MTHMSAKQQLARHLSGTAARTLLAVSTLLLLLQACSDEEKEVTVAKQRPAGAAQQPMNVQQQPYMLVPVPQGNWGQGGVPQAPASGGWGQVPSVPQVPATGGWGQAPSMPQAPVQGQPYRGANPWQPGQAQAMNPAYQAPQTSPWGSATNQSAPVMPQFRPLDGQKEGQGAQLVAPYDRPEGSSRNPAYPSVPGYGYPGYGYPGYGVGPYGYPGARPAW